MDTVCRSCKNYLGRTGRSDGKDSMVADHGVCKIQGDFRGEYTECQDYEKTEPLCRKLACMDCIKCKHVEVAIDYKGRKFVNHVTCKERDVLARVYIFCELCIPTDTIIGEDI